MSYDSLEDTKAHIARVNELLTSVSDHLRYRGSVHDYTKMQEPEKAIFDQETPKLSALTYGSDEYKEALGRMKVALQHHYEHNAHHPEHHAIALGELNTNEVKDGTAISRMNLEEIIEMLCDWKAASERHANGDIYRSIEMNQERFGYSHELKCILHNTAQLLGWYRDRGLESKLYG